MVAIKENRPFLKWAGGKFRLLKIIKAELSDAEYFVEPFVGSGVVFLNTDYSNYLLADANQDLINLYNIIKSDSKLYIKESKKLFITDSNDAEFYYARRFEFNQSTDLLRRATLFLYLNRHCYNGLCRYNRTNQFNVPFGRYVKPYFPEAEINFFAEKAQHAKFICSDFQQFLTDIPKQSMVYCDPPYAPINNQLTNFNAYNNITFSLQQQQQLAKLAEQLTHNSPTRILISNHNTRFTRQIYHRAKLKKFSVRRFINSNVKERNKAREILAIYESKQNKYK